MKIYKYSENTKEYLGYMEAYLDPLETAKRGKEVFVIPPYFTTVKPEIPQEGYTMLFNGENWKEVEDHRGLTVYNKKTGNEKVLTELGPIPDIYQLEKPVFLEELRISKINELDEVVNLIKREVFEVNGIKSSVENWVELPKYLPAFGLFPIVNVNDIMVTKEELEEAIKYFHVKSILLTKKREEILNIINSARSKKKLQEMVINVNMEDEIKDLMKLSKEELSERFAK